MKKEMVAIIVIAMLSLTGCETIKAVISAPFVGLEKDVQNTAAASNKLLDEALNDSEDAKERGTLRRVDDWMQKNWW